MALATPYQNYRQQQISTASQDKLLLMLFDGAIRFCNQAKLALEEKKFEEANINLIKAQNIVQEFMITLDMEYEISHRLLPLYEYFYSRLVEANLKKDQQILAEVMSFLNDLRMTFAECSLKARTAQPMMMTGGATLEG